MNETPTWDQYRIHLVNEMDRMATAVERLADRLDDMERQLVAQSATAHERAKWTGAMWGGMVSAAMVFAKIIWDLIFRKG